MRRCSAYRCALFLLPAALWLAGCTADAPTGTAEGSAWTTAATHYAPPDSLHADSLHAATLRAVRAEKRDDFDRVTFTFAGHALPGYRVAPLAPPVRQCGSGRAVPVMGARFLQVRFRPVRAHSNAGQATVADRNRAPRLPALKGLTLTCDFEGTVTWVLGLPAGDSASAGETAASYRVHRHASPPRLTVDVRD